MIQWRRHRWREGHGRLEKQYNNVIPTGYHRFAKLYETHEGLDGKAPEEASGIKIEGENKWITLIQHAEFTKNDKKSSFQQYLCAGEKAGTEKEEKIRQLVYS